MFKVKLGLGVCDIHCDSFALQAALFVGMKNTEEHIELIQQQIDELTAHYHPWLDGKDGGDVNAELDVLFKEYRKQIKALAVMNTLYQEL
jgi:hypothetical protein